MKTSIRSLFIAMVLVCGFQSLGLALSADPQKSTQLQFNFITPGARAIALGGAFIGLADDATAVESNPAGLTQLLAPEVSAEFKYFHFTTEHVDMSSEIEEFANSVATVPFVSYVYPYKRFVFSIYRQESVKFIDSYQTGIMWELIIVSSPEEFFIIRKHFLSDNSVELSVTNYGIGAAIQIFDGFSLAVSPRWSWMTAKLHSIFNGGNVGIGEYEEIIDDDDSEFSLNAGLLWSPHPRVSIGAVYKIGAEFAVKPTLVTIQEPNDPVFSDYEPDFADKFTLKVPDSFGIGVAFRATDFLTFTLDAVHIQYKDLLKDFDVPGYIGLGHPEEYVVNNATEIHIGVEYILPLGKEFLALRAGIYNDPAHNIRRYSDSYEPMTYSPRGEDQIHVTGGLGIIHSDRFQIDTAVDIADKRKQFSFSMVYRFGGGRSKTRDTKPNLTSAPPPKPIEEVHPSVTFTVVKFDKTLEIQSVTTETPGVSDVNVTIKQAGKTSFIVTAALEKGREKLTTDIRIDIEQQKFKAEEMDQRGQVKVLSEKQKSLEVMVTFK